MFDTAEAPGRRIAVIGSGISGLAAAHYLSSDHDVTLYEAAPRLGGHARTVMAGRNGDVAVDTGFIVFNYATYPHLTRLFDELDVPVMKSNMSFGASIDGGRIEYGLTTPRSLVAQKRNLFRPRYYGMIADILRFGKRAVAAATDDDKTIGELIEELRLGYWFRHYYLMPMCGAIWSTPVSEIDGFPARSLVQFFRNHALLAFTPEHQWFTVKGGSIEYVQRNEASLLRNRATIHKGAPVAKVHRTDVGVVVSSPAGEQAFDEVVFACHSDQALKILGSEATAEEVSSLSAIRYQTNKAVLHRDPNQMPRRKACWSSWAYRSQDGAIGVTYWMNRLQGIPDDEPMFVTLNPPVPIPDELVYDRVDYEHPMFDRAAMNAQRRIRAMQGRNRTWFAGAWNRHGFHEDGIHSAVEVVEALRAREAAGAPHVDAVTMPA